MAEAVRHQKAAIAEKPSPERGKMLFKKNCAVCHKLDNEGVDVGPDPPKSVPRSTAASLVPDTVYQYEYPGTTSRSSQLYLNPVTPSSMKEVNEDFGILATRWYGPHPSAIPLLPSTYSNALKDGFIGRRNQSGVGPGNVGVGPNYPIDPKRVYFG